MPDTPSTTPPSLARALGLAAAVVAVSLLAHRIPSPVVAEGVRIVAILLAGLLLVRRHAAAEAGDRARIERLETQLRRSDRLHAMCSHCKSIRETDGRWLRLEDYLEHHFQAAVTHGVCPECMRVEYPGLFENLTDP